MNYVVKYFGGDVEVKLGDHVRTRFWGIIPTKGRVVYVPGVSPKHPKMEINGMRWVGLKCDDGDVIGLWVNPETDCLKKHDRFLHRDENPVDEIKPTQELD